MYLKEANYQNYICSSLSTALNVSEAFSKNVFKILGTNRQQHRFVAIMQILALNKKIIYNLLFYYLLLK